MQAAETRRTIRLSRAQHEFHHSRARYRGFVGGRGAGKTWVGVYDTIRRARPGGSYLVGSPTGVMMHDITFPAFKRFAEELDILRGERLSPYPTLHIATSDRASGIEGVAEIRFRTAENPDKMRGPNLRGAWLDEASLMHEDVRRVLLGALRDGQHVGGLSATFTPAGPLHWTYEAFASGLPNTAMFRAKTNENPFTSPEFVELLREQYGDTLYARQEIDGEFVSIQGSEFPGEWFERSDFWFDGWPDGITLAVVALDPSKGSDGRGTDYQAHATVAVRVEDRKIVLYVDADLRREGVTQMCERTISICRTFANETGHAVDSVVCEENATMGLLAPAMDAASAKLGYLLPYILRTNADNKEFRIRYYCAPPLSRYQIRVRRTEGGRMLVSQLRSFPHDEHDDGPDALSTALRRVSEMLQSR